MYGRKFSFLSFNFLTVTKCDVLLSYKRWCSTLLQPLVQVREKRSWDECKRRGWVKSRWCTSWKLLWRTVFYFKTCSTTWTLFVCLNWFDQTNKRKNYGSGSAKVVGFCSANVCFWFLCRNLCLLAKVQIPTILQLPWSSYFCGTPVALFFCPSSIVTLIK